MMLECGHDIILILGSRGGGGGKRDLHHSSRREAIVAKNVDSSRHSFRMYSKVEDVVAEVM